MRTLQTTPSNAKTHNCFESEQQNTTLHQAKADKHESDKRLPSYKIAKHGKWKLNEKDFLNILALNIC